MVRANFNPKNFPNLGDPKNQGLPFGVSNFQKFFGTRANQKATQKILGARQRRFFPRNKGPWYLNIWGLPQIPPKGLFNNFLHNIWGFWRFPLKGTSNQGPFGFNSTHVSSGFQGLISLYSSPRIFLGAKLQASPGGGFQQFSRRSFFHWRLAQTPGGNPPYASSFFRNFLGTPFFSMRAPVFGATLGNLLSDSHLFGWALLKENPLVSFFHKPLSLFWGPLSVVSPPLKWVPLRQTLGEPL